MERHSSGQHPCKRTRENRGPKAGIVFRLPVLGPEGGTESSSRLVVDKSDYSFP